MIETPFGELDATHEIIPDFGEVYRVPLDGEREVSIARTKMTYGNKSGEGLWEVLEFDGTDAIGEPVGWQDERQVRSILRDEYGFDLPDVRAFRELLNVDLVNTYVLDLERANVTLAELGGSQASHSDFAWKGTATIDPAYEVEVAGVPVTAWGDYGGDICGRANFVWLLENYPDTFITAGYGTHDGQSLYLPVDAEIPAALFEVLEGLADYPVIDEDLMSEIESEIEQEDWDGYARHDLQLDAERQLDALEDEGRLESAEDFHLADATADTLAWLARRDGSLTWECETATNGYYRGLEDLAGQYVEQVLDALDRDREGYARTLDNPLGKVQLDLSV